jgi:regulator of RNase E activity RraA
MSAAAQARSLKGVVISGRCRDVTGHRSLGFPVFARATSILGPTSFTRSSQLNVPLVIKPQIFNHETKFPSITVEPGDWIVADGEGVVCIPRGLEQQVMQMAENGMQVDELCNADIRAERGFQKAFVRFSAKFEV